MGHTFFRKILKFQASCMLACIICKNMCWDTQRNYRYLRYCQDTWIFDNSPISQRILSRNFFHVWFCKGYWHKDVSLTQPVSHKKTLDNQAMFLIKCVHYISLHCFVSVPAMRVLRQTKQSVKPFDVFCTPFFTLLRSAEKRLFFIVARQVYYGWV